MNAGGWAWDKSLYAGSAAHYGADGAWIHVSATTHRGVAGDDPLPHPRPPWDRVHELVASYLGPVRRAGRGVLPAGTRGGEEEIMRRTGFTGPGRLDVGGGEVDRPGRAEHRRPAGLTVSSRTKSRNPGSGPPAGGMLKATDHVRGRQTMATFMDVHDGFVGATAQDLQAAHDRDLAIEADEGVHFERAWMDPVSGKAFCLSSGPSKEAIMRIHERAGHGTTEVYEVPIQV